MLAGPARSPQVKSFFTENFPANRHSYALSRAYRLANERTRLERQDYEENAKDDGVRGD
jgi:hypothetical protein